MQELTRHWQESSTNWSN